MEYKLKGIEPNTTLEVETTDATLKLNINNIASINLSYNEICDLSNLLNKMKESIFDDAALDLGY